MSWAKHAIEKLQAGEPTSIRPRGNSMAGKVESGELVHLKPISEPLEIGDIVLCRVKGRDYLHLVKAIQGNRYLIGNNRGGVNGWTGTIFGKLVKK